jgi:hypothetical protein
MEQGKAVLYALNALEERRVLFISPSEKLYEGMIIGENAKPQGLEINPRKSRHLTNFRSTGKDGAVRLTPPRRMTLERAIANFADDELVEVLRPQLAESGTAPSEKRRVVRRRSRPRPGHLLSIFIVQPDPAHGAAGLVAALGDEVEPVHCAHQQLGAAVIG